MLRPGQGKHCPYVIGGLSTASAAAPSVGRASRPATIKNGRLEGGRDARPTNENSLFAKPSRLRLRPATGPCIISPEYLTGTVNVAA